MSIGSDIRDDANKPESVSRRETVFSSAAVPYVLSTMDAFVIVSSSLLGGIGYQFVAVNPIASVLPYWAVGLLASFIHILRMSGSVYYDFPESAKPRVEIGEILV